MWCRFAFFTLCCFAATNCISEKDEGVSQRSQSAVMSEGNLGRGVSTKSTAQGNGDGETLLGRSSSGHRNYEQEQEINTNSKNTENRQNYGEEHLSGQLMGQWFNSESNHQTNEFATNNHGQSSRPAGETFHNGIRRPGLEGRPTDRPVVSPSNNREGNNPPDRGNEKEQSSVQPTGQSPHATHHVQEGIRPTEHTPDSAGEHSFGRPTGGLGVTTSHNNGDVRPGNFKPSNEMLPLGRPTGESIHGQQTGFRPNEQGGQSGHSSTDPKPDQFTSQQSGAINKETENNNDDGKEEDKDVCFPNLGCFKMGKPWKSILRPIGPPHGPEKIQTTVHFYSRANKEKQANITMYPQINMGEAQFDPNKITAIIVHGFSNSGNATWMKDMKNVYLNKVDANVLIVDWGKGAQLLNYLQVAGNTRVVGKQLGLFVKYLIENYGAHPGKFHLIGHSLGAQICSYLAKEVPGMARLTALDPAQPGFEGFGAELRLDKNDAEFVDVIHTDARPFIPTLGFGMITPHGHVDFYMNGGFDQPGCIPPPKKELPSIKNILDLAKYPVEVIAKAVACPHGRAYEYLIEAFNETEKCIFWGHKADVKNVFKSVTNTVTQGLLKKFTALSSTCSKQDCIPLGFATKKSPLRGVFVVTTGNRSPYCISEPGIPPEMPPQERRQESFIQKIGKKTALVG